MFLHRRFEEQKLSSGSVCNLGEANTVVEIVRSIDRQSDPERIRVITFYKAQVALIRKQLRLGGFSDVLVATVDSSQGCEADIVLISFVRSRTLGFIRDDRRMNVALTRARYQLVCIGNVERYPHFENARTIQALVDHAHTNAVVVSND